MRWLIGLLLVCLGSSLVLAAPAKPPRIRVKIERATKADVMGIWKVLKAANAGIPRDAEIDHTGPPSELDTLFNHTFFRSYVIRKGGEIVSALSIWKDHTPRRIGWFDDIQETPGTIFVVNLGTAPAFQHRGYARALRTAVLDAAAAAGFRTVLSNTGEHWPLGTSTEHTTREFFETFGSKVVGRLTEKDGFVLEHSVVMKLDLGKWKRKRAHRYRRPIEF